MPQIIKMKALCKGSHYQFDDSDLVSCIKNYNAQPTFPYHWKTIFQVGTWYDIEYQLWSDDPIKNSDMVRMNDGYSNYWAITKTGEKIKLQKAIFHCVFPYIHKLDEMRESKIYEILDGK